MAKTVHTFKVKTLTNRIAFEAYLKTLPSISAISRNYYLDSLETKEFGNLLASHGLSRDVYQCDDILGLFSIYEELQQHATPLSQAALRFRKASSRCIVKRGSMEKSSKS